MNILRRLALAILLAATGGVATAQEADAKKSQPEPSGLTPQAARQLAELMDRDWKQQPEWAQEMVALLRGGGMGPGEGWFNPSKSRYDWKWFSKRFDANDDGRVSVEELPESKQRALFFARLDVDRNAVISQADFQPPRSNPNTRFASQLFYRLDVDSNGRLTPDEVTGFFAAADSTGEGFLTPDDLRFALAPPPAPPRQAGGGSRPSPGDMIAMLLRGELGSLGSGPNLGQKAPDFKLKTYDDSAEISLAQLKAKKKPVVLIFGSFT